ncbi:hypothetical protein NDU88_006986 [Pleurodeles waltl]|uniref:Uncharacterized protein n=1 Tax=Pleurodeles waltl TaxID=8319 RepID=A0AAV7WGC9_PLEWA|nr:hypothetical protein NDU88_006986 [Pleurodeles waltl]
MGKWLCSVQLIWHEYGLVVSEGSREVLGWRIIDYLTGRSPKPGATRLPLVPSGHLADTVASLGSPRLRDESSLHKQDRFSNNKVIHRSASDSSADSRF